MWPKAKEDSEAYLKDWNHEKQAMDYSHQNWYVTFSYIHMCETYVNYSHKGTLLCNNRVWVMAECNRNNSQGILTFKKASYSLNCNPTQGERCGKNKMSANWHDMKIEKNTGNLKDFKSKYWGCFVSVSWIIDKEISGSVCKICVCT